MEKDLKGDGIRKGCTECHYALLKAAELLEGIGGKQAMIKIKDTCRHCKSKQTIEIGKKGYIEVYKTILLVLIAFTSILSIWRITGLDQKFAYLINTYDFIAK